MGQLKIEGIKLTCWKSRNKFFIIRFKSLPSLVQCFFYTFRCCGWLHVCCSEAESVSLTVWVGIPTLQAFPPNVLRNQKYSIFTFLSLVLLNQFKFFLNLYFLVMACSQFIPQLRIGEKTHFFTARVNSGNGKPGIFNVGKSRVSPRLFL